MAAFPGMVSACLGLLLLKVGIVGWIESFAYVPLFHLRGPIGWDERVITIEIDDKSLKALGQFPWSRERYAQLIETLIPAQPSVIAFDLLLVDPSAEDAALATAMARQGRVVLAQAWNREGQQLLPVPVLREGAIATGHIHTTHDNKGVMYQVYPYVQDAAALALVSLQAHNLVFDTALTLPPSNQPLWINWPGPTEMALHYSFIDVVRGQVSPHAFTNKIVMVGVTATGFDALTTPYDRNLSTSGVYLHVSLLNNLLRNNLLKPMAASLQIPLLACFGPGLSLLLSHRRLRTKLLMWWGLGLVWSSVGLMTFIHSYWLPIIGPVGLISLTSCAVLLTDRLRPYMMTLVGQLCRPVWIDSVTQIANHRAFDQYLSQSWCQSIHDHRPLSLLLCDIEDFQHYNDTYGTQAGDDCLRRIAQLLEQATQRHGDFVARYGGEVFGVILPNTDHRGACWVAEKLCQVVQSLKIVHAGAPAASQLTISIGVATQFPKIEQSPGHLIDLAYQSLYQAKASGRNRIAVAIRTLETPSAQ
jgi:diguanylate cyclase (GGDEF)-like protein